MGQKIITKTDRQMEDRMMAVASDPERADTLQKARAFKRTWLELAQALSKIQSENAWERWGFVDFDSYCKKELHLRGSKGAADEETLQTMHRVAFEEGGEVNVLRKEFGELAFPVTDRERKEKVRTQITAAARRLSALIAEAESPVPKKLAIRVEEIVGELLETLEN
jgi:hypothetical protein